MIKGKISRYLMFMLVFHIVIIVVCIVDMGMNPSDKIHFVGLANCVGLAATIPMIISSRKKNHQ